MKTLREQHEELNENVVLEYKRLISLYKERVFFDEEDEEENITDCEGITFVSRSGENIDAYVLKISEKDGIYIAKYEDENRRYWIGLNDLSSLSDKITVVELLNL